MSSTPSPPLPPPPPAATATIGIDLGSTNCCVGVFRKEKVFFKYVEIVLSDHGHRVTPSVVALTNAEVLFGDEAKNQSVKNSANTVFGIRRFIGLCFNDQTVQAFLKHYVICCCFSIILTHRLSSVHQQQSAHHRTQRPHDNFEVPAPEAVPLASCPSASHTTLRKPALIDLHCSRRWPKSDLQRRPGRSQSGPRS